MDIKYQNLNKKVKKLTQIHESEKITMKTPTKFHHRVINKTDINLSEQDIALLNKGLKYNLNFRHSNWINRLALEAETAITQLPLSELDYMRYRVADNINKLQRQYNHNKQYNSTHDKHEKKIIDQIKEKIKDNNAVITKADNGNSTVVMSRETYDEKISDFVRNNNFTCIMKDLTTKFQRELRNVINECCNLIHKDNK